MSEPALPHASVFIATSLDGFIARDDGAIDWLEQWSGDGDCGYSDFIASVDTLVLGRASFEKVLTFETWPYAGVRVVVLSSGSPDIPDALRGSVEILNLPPILCLRQLATTGSRRVYVDGGLTIQRFLRAGAIQDLILTRVPVLLGSGRPLFGELANDMVWTHLETTTYPDGLVQSRYRIAPSTNERSAMANSHDGAQR
ncbi:MAG: dihydrofolate reductase family protein [Bacteroidota bacterium]